ncbi:hypothetical protein B0H19DRAFT_1073004 [Mycena capillaripes]|nr:hypothetical protein B0H19DRAFT_1073004 [Mycena capillaripes]
MSTLAAFPEELLEQILADAVIAPATPHPRAPWHISSSGKQTRGRTAPLLVCKSFHRIALPLFYNTLVLHSPSQSAALLAALRARPSLARGVRTLVLPNPCASDAEVLRLLPGLLTLDVSLPNGPDNADALVAATRALRTVRSLTVRKGAGTYLSQPAPRAMLDALADVVSECPELHTTTLTFPLSADPALARLATALSTAPSLNTLRTPLPAVWAPAYVGVSSNTALERICMGDDLGSPSPSSAPKTPERRATNASYPALPRGTRPILPTSLFLSAARPHARLAELIRAGTAIAPAVGGWRGRAATVGAAPFYAAGVDSADAQPSGTC